MVDKFQQVKPAVMFDELRWKNLAIPPPIIHDVTGVAIPFNGDTVLNVLQLNCNILPMCITAGLFTTA